MKILLIVSGLILLSLCLWPGTSYAFETGSNGSRAGISDTLYVNNVTGADTLDGSSPIVGEGTIGPKRTLSATIAVALDGQVICVSNTGVTYDSLITGMKSLRFISTGGSPRIQKISIERATSFEDPFVLASSGSLELISGILTGAHHLTLESGGTVVRAGGSISPGDSPVVTSYNLIYRTAGPVTSTSEEFVNLENAVTSLTVSDSGTVVTLHADRTISNLVLDCPWGGIVLGRKDGTARLSLTGNATISAGNFSADTLSVDASTAPTVAFVGTISQSISLPTAGLTLPDGIDANKDGDYLDAGDRPPIDIEINNTSPAESERKVTLDGGDLLMGSLGYMAGGTVWLKSGIVVTESHSWNLSQKVNPVRNEMRQGFIRSVVPGSFSHFVGNVRKYVARETPSEPVVVVMPVGTLAEPRACYRPMTLTLNGFPSSQFNLTVSHVNSRPPGYMGFPIYTESLVIADYADFYWEVRSDISLAPSLKFDLEAQAEGYTGYVVDRIQNVRMIKRSVPVVNPEWSVVRAFDAVSLYENSILAADWPVVKAIGCSGGITTQGTFFTYGKASGGAFVVTTPASEITSTSATLNADVFTSNPACRVWFEWGQDFQMLTFDTVSTATLINGDSRLLASAPLAGLIPNTVYYFRAAGTDSGGVERGSLRTFVTTKEPVVAGPSLIAPADTANNVSLTPTLSWSPFVGSSYYELQVSTLYNFSTFVYDDTTSGTSFNVGPLNPGKKYFWRVRGGTGGVYGPFSSIRVFMTTLNATVVHPGDELPSEIGLAQNYPNPFNPSTTIQFALPKASRVSLKVFDMLGVEVATLVSQELPAGYFTVRWQANVSSGTYIYRLQAGAYVETRKMILLR